MNTFFAQKNIQIHILLGVQKIQIHKVGLVSISKLFLSKILQQKSERLVATKQDKENLEIGLIWKS